MDFLVALDRQLFVFLNGLHVPAADVFFFWASVLGQFGITFPAAVVAVLLFSRRNRYPRFFLMIAALLAVNRVTAFLKLYFARPRPFDALPPDAVHLVGLAPGDFSFPSGHASLAFALAAVCVMLFGRRWRWGYLPAGLIGYSRIYLGVHYPADVLAGIFTGILGAWAVLYAVPGFRRFLALKHP